MILIDSRGKVPTNQWGLPYWKKKLASSSVSIVAFVSIISYDVRRAVRILLPLTT